jgi:hypothetical protein
MQPANRLAATASDLVAHAAHVESLAGDVDAAVRAGNTVRLDPGAYGQLCTFLPPMMDGLQGVLVDCMADTARSLRDTGERLRGGASAIRSTSELSATSLRQVIGPQ